MGGLSVCLLKLSYWQVGGFSSLRILSLCLHRGIFHSRQLKLLKVVCSKPEEMVESIMEPKARGAAGPHEGLGSELESRRS